MKYPRAITLMLALCLALTLTVPAFASGEASGASGDMPAGSSTGAPSVSYQSWEVLADNAGIVIENGAVTVAEDADYLTAGVITPTEVSGTYMYYANIGPWNKTATLADGGTAGQSGVVINNRSDGPGASDEITIGGEELLYSVESDHSEIANRQFNTVVILDNKDKGQMNPLGADSGTVFDEIEDLDNPNCTFPGVGVYVAANKLSVKNALIETIGTHRPALYTVNGSDPNGAADQHPTVVLTDSVLMGWGSQGDGSSAPTFTGMYGSTRPTLLNSDGDIYFYNSAVYGSDWGAYSLDQASGTNLYIVNTYSLNTVGGYGVYALGADNAVWMYGAKTVSPQYGIILCAQGSIYMNDIQSAYETREMDVTAGAAQDTVTFTSDAMAEFDGVIDEADYIVPGGGSFVAGSVNAVSFTADMSGQMLDSHLVAENTYFSTLDQDVADEDGNLLTDIMEYNARSYLADYAPITNGAPYFFFKHIDGATLCYRSINNETVLKNSALASKNGVVIQSALGYDPSAGGINVADGTEYVGVNITLEDMDVTGDILHEDYQRKMDLSLVDTKLTGAVVTGTMAGWNAAIEFEVETAWNSVDPFVDGTLTVGQVAEAAGISMESTIATLEKNDAYESFWGARMSLDANSAWTVTGDSSLAELTVEDGARIEAPAGRALTVYTNVDMDNTMTAFDVTSGIPVDELVPGTYHNVVIVVTGAASADPSGEASA